MDPVGDLVDQVLGPRGVAPAADLDAHHRPHVRADDLEPDRGVDLLITTTPEIAGRSFGTNVLEAALLALLGKAWRDVVPADYERLLHELRLRPRVLRLSGRP